MSEKEYVVTLHSYTDLQSFYEDMETPGGNLYIPDRAVPVIERSLMSRNIHYKLTEEEAELVRQDPRVMAVELSIQEQGLSISPSWTQTSAYWNKSTTVASPQMKNWGLLRCIEGNNFRQGWGSNGDPNAFGTITATASGKHVDVVVVDGHMNPNHPEFAENSDGTGGTRVVQYNWFSLTSQVIEGGINSTYVYTPYVDPSYPDYDQDGASDRTVNNDHGAHVAGTFAGNTQGWARAANIYNISPYTSSPSATSKFLNYIKYWHKNKQINPITGIKNPTVINCSWGVHSNVPISSITSVRYRGTIITGDFSKSTLALYGIATLGSKTYTSNRNTALEQDLIDLISEGIIVVGSADNCSAKIANYSEDVTDDYNNYYAVGSTKYYYNRGTVTSADGIIVVGAIGTSIFETKIDTSNCGPRVNVYAPGRSIISSFNSNMGISTTDPRSLSYFLSKISGTSMASPQVAGVLACVAEIWPRLRQSDAHTYIQKYAQVNQVVTTSGGPSDPTDIQGSPNLYLYLFKERYEFGQVSPKQNQGFRPAGGMLYPRTKIFRYGR